MPEQPKADLAERLESSKARISDKLAELGRRVDAIQERTHELKELATRPAVVFGVAAALGLWLGSRRPRTERLAISADHGMVRVARTHPGILRSAVREVVVVAAGMWTRKYIEKRLSGA